MAQFLENRFSLDLARGFFLHVVVRFNTQQHDGRKTFFEAGEMFGGPKVSIYLDDADRLRFEATDVLGKVVTTDGVAPEKYGTGWLVLWCELTQGPDDTELLLFVNGGVEASVKVPNDGRWGSPVEVNCTLGVNLLQQEACAFSLAEIFVGDGGLPDEGLLRMLAHVHEYFKLPDAERPFELRRHLGVQ